jgi:hypothetical protein
MIEVGFCQLFDLASLRNRLDTGIGKIKALAHQSHVTSSGVKDMP